MIEVKVTRHLAFVALNQSGHSINKNTRGSTENQINLNQNGLEDNNISDLVEKPLLYVLSQIIH